MQLHTVVALCLLGCSRLFYVVANQHTMCSERFIISCYAIALVFWVPFSEVLAVDRMKLYFI